MNIEGTIVGSFVGASLTHNNDSTSMRLDVDVVFDQKQALGLIDEDFAMACFSGLRKMTEPCDDDDAAETVWRFAYATKKPPGWMTCSIHKVDLWGTELDLQPKIKKITAGDGIPMVTVRICFDVLVNKNKEMIGALGCQTGQLVKLTFAPKNLQLPFKTEK